MDPRRSLRRADDADEAIVLHRTNVVVAEITRSIEEKSEKRFRRVKRIAKELEELSDASVEWKSETASIASISGARAALELRAVEKLAVVVARFSQALDWLLRHEGSALRGVLGDKQDDVVDALRAFIDWVPRYRDSLMPKATEFNERFTADVRDDKDRQKHLAAAWQSVDGDGLR
jgi:hypothetical protein